MVQLLLSRGAKTELHDAVTIAKENGHVRLLHAQREEQTKQDK